MQEIGHAALAILPSFSGFEAKLESGSSKAMLAAGASGGRKMGSAAGDEATKGIGSKITDWSKRGALAVGGIAGVAVGLGLREGLEREAIGDKVAASLGLDPKAQQQQGKVAGSLYAHAFGESYEDVANAVAATTSSLPKLQGNGEIRRASRDALNFAAVFDIDIPRAVSVASTIINSKLAPNAKAAFDLLTRSSQKVPVALREDILDAAEEYGQFFHTLGYDGPAAFDLLVAGSKQGMYGIDKAGDAIKEFTIRSTDGSKATNAAYELIGLSSDTMANKILKGGDDAQAATQQIIDGLLAIESPSTRANAAIALFGTPIEDLNVSKIPAFLKSLQGTEGGLDDVKGAAERMGDTLNDNTSTKITALKRKLETDLVEFMSKKGLPALESFSDWMTEDGLPALDKVADYAGTAADKIGSLVGAFNDLPDVGKIAALGGSLAGGLVVKHKLAGIFDRGGIGNPMFVTVTNPGLGGGLGGAAGGAATAGGKGALLRGAAKATIVGAAAVYLGNQYIKYVTSDPEKGYTTNDNKDSTDPNSKWADPRRRLGSDELATYLDATEKKAQGLGRELDLVGNKKVEPLFAVPGLAKGRAGLQEFLRLQIEAGKPITPYIDTTSIERAIDVAATLNATLRNQADVARGADGGVNYQHGGTKTLPDNPRAGVNVIINGDVRPADSREFYSDLQKKSRRHGHGGFGG